MLRPADISQGLAYILHSPLENNIFRKGKLLKGIVFCLWATQMLITVEYILQRKKTCFAQCIFFKAW